MKKQYTYMGPVYVFDRLVADRWTGSTWAVSKEKAITNLKYRFRKDNRIENYTPISMPGELVAN